MTQDLTLKNKDVFQALLITKVFINNTKDVKLSTYTTVVSCVYDLYMYTHASSASRPPTGRTITPHHHSNWRTVRPLENYFIITWRTLDEVIRYLKYLNILLRSNYSIIINNMIWINMFRIYVPDLYQQQQVIIYTYVYFISFVGSITYVPLSLLAARNITIHVTS